MSCHKKKKMSWILWIVLFSITIYSLCVFIHIVKLVISRKNDDAPIMQPSNNKKKIRTMIIMGSGIKYSNFFLFPFIKLDRYKNNFFRRTHWGNGASLSKHGL